MDNDLYNKFINLPGAKQWEKDHSSLEEKSVQNQLNFFQYALLVSSSVFGILISLHNTASKHQNIQIVFLISIVLLALGIFFSGAALYKLSMKDEYLRKRALDELKNVLSENGYAQQNVRAGNKTIVKFFRICSISSLSLSVISLTVYAFLITL